MDLRSGAAGGIVIRLGGFTSERMRMTDAGALVIRRATEADAAAVAELALRSFMDAFAAKNRPEDVGAYTSRVYGAAQQAAEIADPDIATFVGEVDGRMAAYAQVHRGPTAPGVDDPTAVEIMRFYVDQPWHGRGIAQRMMDAALQAARDFGARSVWLGVWEHNPRGIAFYNKLGFRVVASHHFLLGSDLQNDFVMTRPLDQLNDTETLVASS
ncbi:GNAT family N-acetyltransferase [Longimicrobium sp.]|uniref:GNAT family N-acetyltransferase n=1 Tax=Longimicrobium sp. TaxID=2029185 RepID=UPI002E2F1706|nr:GNAT family N-acetyltransferase [Longimicrobium sp.]HEX6041435.1 GNAT family N-acetyltransferase [Longimicrobium sp.]